MSIRVRIATIDDARAIATVRIDSWRAAYKGLIPESVLDGLDLDREAAAREERWGDMHVDARAVQFLAEVDGELAGWAAAGPGTDDDLPAAGQLYALYALPRFWGHGVGHTLLDTAESSLRSSGFVMAALWHLDGNVRAGTFYERHGWLEDGAEKFDDRPIGGLEVPALHERRRTKPLS